MFSNIYYNKWLCRKTVLWNQCYKMSWSLFLGTGENSFLGVYRRKIHFPASIFNTRQGWKSPVTKLLGSYQRGRTATTILTHHWGTCVGKSLSSLGLVPYCPVNHHHKAFWGSVSLGNQCGCTGYEIQMNFLGRNIVLMVFKAFYVANRTHVPDV